MILYCICGNLCQSTYTMNDITCITIIPSNGQLIPTVYLLALIIINVVQFMSTSGIYPASIRLCPLTIGSLNV